MTRFRASVLSGSLALSSVALLACAGTDSGNDATTHPGTGGKGAGGSGPGAGQAGAGGTPGGVAGGAGSKTPCGSPASNLADGKDTGTETCDNGALHLAEDLASCPFVATTGVSCTASPGGPGGGPPGQCSMDSECGPSGRCELHTSGAGQFCGCVAYCATDADCSGGATCVCGAKQGTCMKTSCTSDKDCEGGLCLSTRAAPAPGACGLPAPTFACTTDEDTCVVDADCGDKRLCALVGARRGCVEKPADCPPPP